MEESQQHHHESADQEFEKSLNQLQQILQQKEADDEKIPELKTDSASHSQKSGSEESLTIDLAAWEDAVADIEQYLEGKGN
jgi:hypothetical protein